VGTQADYTTPDMRAYRSSAALYQQLFDFEKKTAHGLNGALLLFISARIRIAQINSTGCWSL